MESSPFRVGQRENFENTTDISFKGFRSRIIAYREVKIVKSFLTKIVNKGMKILDLPCGTGKLGPILSDFPIEVVAGDVSKSMISLAEAEYQQNKIDFKRQN